MKSTIGALRMALTTYRGVMKNFIEELTPRRMEIPEITESRMVVVRIGGWEKWKDIGQRVKISSYNINKFGKLM